MATIVNGRALALHIQEELATKVGTLSATPQLSIIVVGEDPVTQSFVRAKRRFAETIGVTFNEYDFPASISTEELVAHIHSISDASDGIVVQLPLPKSCDTKTVLNAVPIAKDVDVLGDAAFEEFKTNKNYFLPPVAGAVKEILEKYSVPVTSSNIVVIGKGKLVGLPARIILERHGAHVFVIDSKTTPENFAQYINNADIIVSGAGIPNLIRPEMVKKDVVLIDAGTSSAGGSVEGDISQDCESVARIFSRTPGGVGPMTVAILFRNLIQNL